MGKGSVRQINRRAALNAQAGQRRERHERERRIDALAVDLLVALSERDAAERRAGALLQTVIDREQLSFRQLGDSRTKPAPFLGESSNRARASASVAAV